MVHLGRHAEAVASYRKAAELNPKNAENWHDLSQALLNSGQRDAAFDCVQRAVALDPKLAVAQYSMGWHLQEQHRWDEAMACYRKAIEIAPDYAEANCNLAVCLASAGRFAEALPFMRRGHEAGSKLPGWSHPSAEWLRQTEINASLEERLPALLAGEIDPVDNAERLAYAQMCWRKGLLRAEVKLLSEAIANDPTLVDDLAAGHRYDAACSAAGASAGLGKDSAQIDDRERSAYRRPSTGCAPTGPAPRLRRATKDRSLRRTRAQWQGRRARRHPKPPARTAPGRRSRRARGLARRRRLSGIPDDAERGRRHADRPLPTAGRSAKAAWARSGWPSSAADRRRVA
jgi:hypothetical protein